MRGEWLPPLAALLPILGAPLAWVLGRRGYRRAIMLMLCVSTAALALTLGAFIMAAGGNECVFALEGFCGGTLRMRADGFRALYASVAGFMWLVCSAFSLDYFAHEEDAGRYALFTLLTLGAVIGLFLSDTLYSAFVFFEIMSLASYPWVAHERTREALRAAETYLYIAIIGGLVMLMGLFLLPEGLYSVPFGELPKAAEAVGLVALRLPALLMLFGFGAKAGAFPLHIWLPKAHPVAPAPASALLSGLLTKAGIFGMLVLTLALMRGDAPFADLIFRLGVITMVLGAVLAVLSTNLKRTLACSSLSQIGFIMIGVGTSGLLGEENGLAAFGTIEHMLNHSLFKLVLFLCAGVVAMNTGTLSLDDIRGYGRKKPALRFAFLMGALGIGGIPLLSGFASKSLLHEGILELAAHMGSAGMPYRIGELLFIISGGMTLCYMTKLYVCIFCMKNPERQAEFDENQNYLSPIPKLALCLCAALIPILGILPGQTLSRLAALSMPFLGAEAPVHIDYFSAENLLGALKSIAIGAALYVLVRLWLMRREKDGSVSYINRLPKRLDMEDSLYRPALGLLARVGGAIAAFFDRLPDCIFAGLETAGHALARLLDISPDALHRKTLDTALAPRAPAKPIPIGNRFTYTLGVWADGAARLINRTARRKRPISTSFETLFAAGGEEASKRFRQVTRSISFGLMMFCAGLIATLLYLLM